MTSGIPWHIEGLGPRTHQAVREAARHSGISIGDWLDRVILDSALKDGIDPRRAAQARHGSCEGGNEDVSRACCLDRMFTTLRAELAETRDALRAFMPAESLPGVAHGVQQLSQNTAKLIDKLDASDARLNQLEAIERASAELLIHLARRRAPDREPVSPAPDLDGLRRDIAELRRTEAKIQGALEEIESTLAQVLDRLAVIEINTRREVALPTEASSPLPVEADRLSPAASTPPTSPITPEDPATPTTVDPACSRPHAPMLSPDNAPEPTCSSARGPKPATPIDEVTASESAIGGGKLSVMPDRGGRSDLIAAARRAGQAASGPAIDRENAAGSTKVFVVAPEAPASGIGGLQVLIGATAATLIALVLLQVARTLVTPSDQTTIMPSYTAVSPNSLPDAIPLPSIGEPTGGASVLDAFLPGSMLEPEATGKVRLSPGATSDTAAPPSPSTPSVNPAPSPVGTKLDLAMPRRAQ